MSDSGFPQFPPGGSGNGPRDPANIPGLSRGAEDSQNTGQRVRIIGVPDDLREVQQTVRINGEVIRENRDGSVRVRTERGDIDIRLPARQTPPQQGQRVEVEIRPGNPPTQAVIRERAPVAQRHAPPPQSQPQSQPQAQATDTRTIHTPVSLEVRPAAEPPPQTQRPAGAVQPQDIVKLLPLAANLAPNIIQPVVELIQSSIIARAEIAAQVIVADAKTQIQQVTNLINIPVQPSVIPEQLSILPLTQPTPVLRTPLPLPPIIQSVLQDQPALNTPPAVPEISFAPPLQSVLTPQIPEQLATALSVPPSPGQTAPHPILQQPFEARIRAIIQPQAQIVPPDTKTQDVTALPAPLIKSPVIHNNPVSNTAHIIGFIQQNLPVISFALPGGETGAPLFVLQTPGSTLPVGTQLQLTPQTALPVITSASLPPLAAAIPAVFLAPEPTWPVLQQIYQALGQISPQAAQALSNVTPQGGNPAQFGPAALFFLAAVRSGDIASWLGDKAADILRRDGKGGLLSRLTQEGSVLNRLSAEPVSQDWRGLSIPHFWQGEMHKMTLYYRHDGSGSEQQEKGKQTRFIFDLSLTNMGKVQLDGLFRGERLDLVVRTENPFSQAMQMEMKRTYTGALGQTQLAGELSFQNRPEQWVKINPTEQTLGVSA